MKARPHYFMTKVWGSGHSEQQEKTITSSSIFEGFLGFFYNSIGSKKKKEGVLRSSEALVISLSAVRKKNCPIKEGVLSFFCSIILTSSSVSFSQTDMSNIVIHWGFDHSLCNLFKHEGEFNNPFIYIKHL